MSVHELTQPNTAATSPCTPSSLQNFPLHSSHSGISQAGSLLQAGAGQIRARGSLPLPADCQVFMAGLLWL